MSSVLLADFLTLQLSPVLTGGRRKAQTTLSMVCREEELRSASQVVLKDEPPGYFWKLSVSTSEPPDMALQICPAQVPSVCTPQHLLQEVAGRSPSLVITSLLHGKT